MRQGNSSGMPLYEFQGKRTDKIDNTIGNTKRTSSLNTPTDILDISAEVAHLANALQLGEESARQTRKAGHDIPANQLLRLRDIALHRHLDLQLAAAEAKVQDLLDVGGRVRRQLRIVLGDLVAARDAQIDAALADEGRDVCGGEEDECDGQVLDQGDVEARLAAELNVAAREKV